MTQEVVEKKKRRPIPAIFDPPVVIEEMSAKINFIETTKEEDDFFAPPKKREIADVSTPTGSFDGCSFSATSQASWRSAFSSICRMSDEWLRHPNQKKTAMKSERLHGQYMEIVRQLHEKWVEMNQGGRWS